MNRRAFTLVELLVVIGILAALVGLVLAAVQHARAAAARAACGNNLRQIALALQHHHTVKGKLPPGIRGPGSDFPFLSWSARILPYLEQPAAWAEAEQDYRTTPMFSGPPPHRNLARVLPVFLCPGDDRRVGTTVEGVTAAFSYYLGVVGHNAALRTGMLFRDSDTRLADAKDGASNTVIVGERPPSPDNHFGWWYAGIGMLNGDGSADSVMSVREINKTFRAPTCPVGPYPFAPGVAENMCDTFHFWSHHPGGAHFAFADGSVRFLRYAADDILPALATRAGGEVVAVP